MAFKYTKSPWELLWRDDDQEMTMQVIAPKDSMENTFNPGRLSEDQNQRKVIAIAGHQLVPMANMEALDNDEDVGNQSLMTHAPEMYELLKDLIGSYTREDYWKKLKKAKKLIDKNNLYCRAREPGFFYLFTDYGIKFFDFFLLFLNTTQITKKFLRIA